MGIKKGFNTKTLVVTALFIALSFAGSHIKILGTIAFDSLPGFLAALLLGPVCGAVIGCLGHLFTALTSGFPLSVPLHLIISATMALTMLGFGFTYKALKNKATETLSLVVTGAAGMILNCPVSLAFSMGTLWVIAGREAALGLLALLPALVFASAANIVLSVILFKSLDRAWNKTR